jgi:hypothetical protein
MKRHGHTVLDTGTPDTGADDGFASLRRPAPSRTERYELGRSLRERAHRSDMAYWSAPAGRPDPVEQIIAASEGRQDWLIPLRNGRMISSP